MAQRERAPLASERRDRPAGSACSWRPTRSKWASAKVSKWGPGGARRRRRQRSSSVLRGLAAAGKLGTGSAPGASPVLGSSGEICRSISGLSWRPNWAHTPPFGLGFRRFRGASGKLGQWQAQQARQARQARPSCWLGTLGRSQWSAIGCGRRAPGRLHL